VLRPRVIRPIICRSLVLIYRLFNDAFSSLCHTASNDRMTNELCIRKDAEGTGRGLAKLLSHNLPGET
jgi:hypothetical protein